VAKSICRARSRTVHRSRRAGGKKTGPNPTDRRKLGSKHYLIVDAQGIPLAVILSAAIRLLTRRRGHYAPVRWLKPSPPPVQELTVTGITAEEGIVYTPHCVIIASHGYRPTGDVGSHAQNCDLHIRFARKHEKGNGAMFRIEAVSSPRCRLTFGNRAQGRNHISVITGPNGSGKTEILTTLSNWFLQSPRTQRPAHTSVRSSFDNRAALGQSGDDETAPSRVIAQTFSPFSRFSPPEEASLTVTDVYAEAAEQTNPYRSIGINRRTRYVGGALAKRTLEQGIFRLTEAPEQARTLAFALDALGFDERLLLVYRRYATGRDLLQAFREGHLKEYLSAQALRPGQRVGNAMQREIQRTGIDRLHALLESVLSILDERFTQTSLEFVFDFRDGRASEDYSVMQALSVLRKLGAVRLEHCHLFPRSRRRTLDLVDASSGQQQMLCSLFGLFSELRSNSLVLIDEPELSLHPTWQMAFLERLGKILEPFDGCHVIIATHSPLIVQSALIRDFEVIQLQPEEHRSPADALVHDREPVSVEGTLLEVFGTPVSGSVYLANELFELVTAGEAGDSSNRQSVLSRLRRLEELYLKKEDFAANEGDVRLIQKAIRVVSEPDDEEQTDGV
jgi:hypothetical protein